MTSLLHRIFPFMAVTAEIKMLDFEVAKGIADRTHKLNAQIAANIRILVESAVKTRDVDALRVYARISPADNALVGLAVAALREAHGVSKVENIITKGHIDAYASILTACLHAQNMKKTQHDNTLAHSVYELSIVAFRNYDRVPDCISIINDRHITDAPSLTDTLYAMSAVHPSLSVGAL